MSEFPSLEQMLARHQPDYQRSCWANERWCTGCDTSHRIWPWSDFHKHQADAWRSACEVRTVEQLEDLPVGAILKDAEDIFCVDELGLVNLSAYGDRKRFDGPELPALLIWSPAWERP